MEYSGYHNVTIHDPTQAEVSKVCDPLEDEDLQDRAKFFSKSLFGITFPYTAYFADEDEMEGARGHFQWAMSSDCEDDSTYEDSFYGTGREGQACIRLWIGLDSADRLLLDSVLIHELLHFYLWYRGLPHEDWTNEFETRLAELGASGRYNRKFDYDEKKWMYGDYDVDKLQRYEDAFQHYLKTGEVQSFEGYWRE